MSGLSAVLLGWAAFGPCLAPVPAAPAVDPLAKPVIGIGASGGPGDDSLVVGSVTKDLPAERAGVRPGDRIVRVGSFHPAGFSEMRRHVMAHRPGAVVELEVERAGGRKVFALKLVPAPPNYGQAVPGVELVPIFPANPPFGPPPR